MEKALLVTIKLKHDSDRWLLEDTAYELEELVSTCGAEAVDNITCVIEKPTPNFFIGSGKVEELAVLAEEHNVDAVIFSHDLSGTQQRNLEELLRRKTIDRTELILAIFARHAKTLEGKTQVELAQLQYIMPRLVGKGLILSQTGGGIGTSGPGEKKLELDRRRIRKRIDRLKADLRNLDLHRRVVRKRRKEKQLPSVALVGYTNAGKSTLLNALTEAGQTVSEGLFTTLDPMSKNLQLPNGEQIIISDTVGFLHNLPHHLIEAFKATLEEVVEADLLVHVIDASSPKLYEYNKAVFEVLKELEVDQKPIITALNKTDLVSEKEQLERIKSDFHNPVLISAKSKHNLNDLLKNIQNNFLERMVELEVMLPHSRMDLVNLFYREGKVESIKYLQEGIKAKIFLPKVLSNNLLQRKEIKIIS
jgi:GTPase